MSDVADILERAADLIANGWVQEAYAKDADGTVVEFDAPEATCFCVGGAIDRLTPDNEKLAIDARHALEKVVGALPYEWNDAPERTQVEVVSKLREAAAKARENDRG